MERGYIRANLRTNELKTGFSNSLIITHLTPDPTTTPGHQYTHTYIYITMDIATHTIFNTAGRVIRVIKVIKVIKVIWWIYM